MPIEPSLATISDGKRRSFSCSRYWLDFLARRKSRMRSAEQLVLGRKGQIHGREASTACPLGMADGPDALRPRATFASYGRQIRRS